MLDFDHFLELVRDAEFFVGELRNKKPQGIKLQGIQPSTLKATAIHYLAKKRGLDVTLNDLYIIYGKLQQTIIKTEKILKELDGDCPM